MVVERFKRDEMLGKVFVHERSNGQLKVMVQETKDMKGQQSQSTNITGTMLFHHPICFRRVEVSFNKPKPFG